jgi:hypothetical protein
MVHLWTSWGCRLPARSGSPSRASSGQVECRVWWHSGSVAPTPVVTGIDEANTWVWLTSLLTDSRPPLAFAPMDHWKSNIGVLVSDADGRRWVLRQPPVGHLLASRSRRGTRVHRHAVARARSPRDAGADRNRNVANPGRPDLPQHRTTRVPVEAVIVDHGGVLTMLARHSPRDPARESPGAPPGWPHPRAPRPRADGDGDAGTHRCSIAVAPPYVGTTPANGRRARLIPRMKNLRPRKKDT